jgi:sulfur-oxidizing protein SoxY
MSISLQRISKVLSLCLLLGFSFQLAGKEVPNSFTDEWKNLKFSLFGDKKVVASNSIIEIEAPFRAEDAAVVPISIKSKISQSPKKYIKKIYLLIDKNPTPVAAIFTLSQKAGRADIETRVRLEEYTFVRAVAELNNGDLHTAHRYVRASGGCSAPAGKDQEVALARLGRMKLRTESGLEVGKPARAQVMVSHPNFSGMQMDQVTRLYVPARFVKKIEVFHSDEKLLTANLDFAISENPNIRFFFTPTGGDNLRAEVLDSKNMIFEKSLAVQN